MADSAFNPLTGDPALVQKKAERYQRIAYAIERSVATLEAMRDGDRQVSKALDQLHDSVENVARDISKARERYAQTAGALLQYAIEFTAASDEAETAITALETARGEATTAAYLLHNAQEAAEEPDADPASSAQTVKDRQEFYAAATDAVAAAEAAWYAARDKKEAAARAAEQAIDDIVNGEVGDQLNDSWWDNHGDFLDKLKLVCEIAAVLAIFFSWVPFFGTALLVLAVVGAVIALVDACVKLSRGEGSIADVVFAAIGAVLAAFGGKALAYLGKLTKMRGFAAIAKNTKFKPWGFKNISGITKANMPGELAKLQSWSGFMNEVVKKSFMPQKPFAEFLSNPWGLEGIDAAMDLTRLSTNAKVVLMVIDVQTVTSKGEKLANFASGQDLPLSPQSMILDGLQAGANGVEHAIRDAAH